MNIIYNVFVKPALICLFGKPMRIVYHGKLDKPKLAYQPDRRKSQLQWNLWIPAIPLIEVCEDEE